MLVEVNSSFINMNNQQQNDETTYAVLITCARRGSTGMLISGPSGCKHETSLSGKTSCFCNYCNCLFKLFNFYNRTKCHLNRTHIRELTGFTFRDCFESACFLSATQSVDIDYLKYAASAINSRFSREYACTFSSNVSTSITASDRLDSRAICDNAQHLFECVSVSDQVGGELFPICGTCNIWHASCSECGAACTFAGAREALILVLFFRYCRLRYDGTKYFIGLKSQEEWIHCSKALAVTIMISQRFYLEDTNYELTVEDPVERSFTVDVFQGRCMGLDFGVDLCARCPRESNLTSNGCAHKFFLHSTSGLCMELNTEMLRLLLTLMPCHGYITGVQHTPEQYSLVPVACGLLSVGGLMGLNLRCNSEFVSLHRELYMGPYRSKVQDHPYLHSSVSCGSYTILAHVNAESQSGSSEDEGQLVTQDDVEQALVRLQGYQDDDDPLLDLVEESRTTTRGLRDLSGRVGTLFKGVTSCIKRLHTVWDWPLDTALKAVEDLGTWLEDNRSYVDPKVWSCQVCPELQDTLQKVVKDQMMVNELFKTSLSKLSRAIDDVTEMNKKNSERVEGEMAQFKAMLEQKRQDGMTAIEKNEISMLQAGLREYGKSLENLTERLDKATAKRPARSRPEPSTAQVGEQMAIPRTIARVPIDENDVQYIEENVPFTKPQPIRRYSWQQLDKHSGETSFVGGETDMEVVKTSHVSTVGPTEEHNAMLAKLYLGSTAWNVSDGEGKVLKSIKLPDAIWSSNERLKDIVQYFQYYTCDGMDFLITTTSVGMQGGTLMVSWDAMSCAARQKIATVLQLSNLPFTLIHASESTNQKFSVDSPAIQHIMCTSGSEASIGELGTLNLSIANGLNATSETSQKIQVNVWVKFRNPKISFYTVKHDLVTSQMARLNVIPGVESLEAIVAQGKWSATSGTNLMELTVHPTACHVKDGLVSQTSLSVISSLFARWRGTLRYRFIFGASMFVKGKLIVSAIPVCFRKDKLTVEQTASFPSIVCDLSSETREFVFDVPYISVGQDSYVTRDALYDVSSYNAEFVVSRLHVLVLDPLVMTANASNSISFFVTVQPGDDFELRSLAGVKTEYVNRVLSQSFGTGMKCSSLMGVGFEKWCSTPSVLCKCELNSSDKNALHMGVSPFYRKLSPCTTSLGWLSQLFVQWSGSLIYTIRAHSNDIKIASFVRIWYDANGSPKEGNEFEFLSEVDPPAGVNVTYWYPATQTELIIRIPYLARTPKLMLNKARYDPGTYDWVHYYNGSLVFDYEGKNSIQLEISISAGDDFEMYEQTVPPRCGKVSNAFTVLSYDKKLVDITEHPTNASRLGGPSNKATITPLKFAKVNPVNEESGSKPSVSKSIQSQSKSKLVELPREGDLAENESGEPLIFRNGAWEFDDDAEPQMMKCLPGMKQVKHMTKDFADRNTCGKIADMVDKGHNAFCAEDGSVTKLMEVAHTLLPILESTKRISGSIEDKLSFLEKTRATIMTLLKPLVSQSIPGIISSAFENESYLWATMLTLIGGLGLLYLCKTKAKFSKKLSIFCMIVWSPLVANSIWSFGKWIKNNIIKYFKLSFDDETCRKHSLAGAFEGVKESLGDFSGWFSDNWTIAVRSLLSILGVVASLIIWGSIPDDKEMNTFAARFKAAGDKGRSFTNIFTGFSTINKMSNEWSKKFVEWIMSLSSAKLPKADSALQQILHFDLRQWVEETREMALQENRFTGFGADEHLLKVRHLYDRSQLIQAALIDGCKVDVQLSMIIKDCRDKCTELMNESYTFKGMKKPRIDPMHLCMIGAPGVGKSTLTHVLINHLLDHRGEPEVDRIYTRCCADAYWSNYHQEPVILYDDLGAIKSNLKLSDYAEIMGVKTNDPFSVPMAGVEDKGKHCTSRYVFSCTNVMELDDTGDVVTKLAYYRRRNILVKVERDEEVERDESNPTHGLLFTVLGYTVAGNNGDRVQFGVKREWDEGFLHDIDTTNWTFERVEYRTFLSFVCKYTDAYMTSQAKLLKGISSFKMTPEMDEVAEAQGPMTTISLEGLMSQIDSLSISAKTFYKPFHRHGFYGPEKWNTRKFMTIKQLLMAMCPCSDSEICDFNIVLSHMNDIIVKSKTRSYEYLVVHRLSGIPEETAIQIKRDNYLAELEPLQLVHFVATVYSWVLRSTSCVYSHCSNEMAAKKELNEDEYDADSRIARNPKLIRGGEGTLFYWDAAPVFFPRCVVEYGCVPIFTGEFYFGCSEENLDCKMVAAKKHWNHIWEFGFELKYDPKVLFSKRDFEVAQLLSGSIEKFGTSTNYSDEVLKATEQARDMMSFGGYLTFFLFLAHLNFERRIRLQEEMAKVKAITDFTASERFKEYEKQIFGGISAKTKIALAIGGAIVASGLLVGAFIGIKAFLSDSIGAIETESAESEICGAHESDSLVTKPFMVQRRSPKIRFTSVERQFTGAHESDAERTGHLVVQRRQVKSVSQGGMGVVYGDDDVRTALQKEKRKTFRRNVRQATKALVKESEVSQILSDMKAWQATFEELGVHSGTTEVYGPVGKILSKNTMNAKSSVAEGVHITSPAEFKKNDGVIESLETLIKMDVSGAHEMVQNGTMIKVEKQAQVGSFGLERDCNMVGLLQTHISKMSCTILKHNQGVYTSFNVLRLKGTFVLAPAHYLEKLGKGDELYFICPHKVVKFAFDAERISLVTNIQDLMVWDLGATVPPSVDFTGHISTQDDWKHFRKTSGVLSLTKYTSEMACQIVHTLNAIELTSADVEVPTGSYELSNSIHAVISGLRYRVHSMPGFCGAAILRADASSPRKIIGMHVAGLKHKGIGYAESLTIEPIVEAMNRLRGDVIISNADRHLVDLCEKHSTIFEGKGNLGVIGVVVDSKIPNVPARTSVAKSLIHGLIGKVKTEPSILSKWDNRLGNKRGIWDPVLDAVKKYGISTEPFPSCEIVEVENHLVKLFKSFENSLRKREINNLEIGINGIDQSDYWSPMEMKTSAGYPYVLEKPSNASGKAWMFKEIGEYPSGRKKFDIEYQKFKDSFNEMHAQIRLGIVPQIVTMECPKDERRKLAKIYDVPATRTFTILPPEINILFRMYFGDFAAMVMTTRQHHFSQVGINPESMEWSDLMISFRKVGNRGFAGDYAKFDGIGSAEIYHSIVNVVNQWYDDGPSNARARHALISSIVHRDGICGNLFLRYSQGMPSGFAMTVIFNSFVNYYFMALAWMFIVSRSDLSPQSDLESFDYFTKLIVYGDDNVVAVADEFLPVYNLRTVASYLSSYGITYTDDSKNPIHLSEPHVDITEVSFLKRNFVPVDRTSFIWKAPLDKTSIEERCNWIRECEVPEEALYQNIESALFEASIHGEAYFQDLKDRLDGALDRVVLEPTSETFVDCQKRWWSNITGDRFSQPDVSNLVKLSRRNEINLNYKFRDLIIGDDVTLSEALLKAKPVALASFAV